MSPAGACTIKGQPATWTRINCAAWSLMFKQLFTLIKNFIFLTLVDSKTESHDSMVLIKVKIIYEEIISDLEESVNQSKLTTDMIRAV